MKRDCLLFLSPDKKDVCTCYCGIGQTPEGLSEIISFHIKRNRFLVRTLVGFDSNNKVEGLYW